MGDDRRFCDMEICVGVRGSAHVPGVGRGMDCVPCLCAGEALLRQSRGVFRELVRTEWIRGTGAPVEGQEGLAVLWGEGTFGGEGMREWA